MVAEPLWPTGPEEVAEVTQQLDELKNDVLATLGRWALTMLTSVVLGAFAVGTWATRQDIRTSQLEAKAVEASVWRESYDKRQRRIEALVVKMAEKQGIDTSRLDQ